MAHNHGLLHKLGSLHVESQSEDEPQPFLWEVEPRVDGPDDALEVCQRVHSLYVPALLHCQLGAQKKSKFSFFHFFFSFSFFFGLLAE